MKVGINFRNGLLYVSRAVYMLHTKQQKNLKYVKPYDLWKKIQPIITCAVSLYKCNPI